MDIEPRDLPLGFLLNTIGRRVFEKTDAALAGDELSVVELGILWTIALDPGRPQADYAKFQKRDVTTFGRYVDRLEEKVFLVRTQQAGDRRVKSLSLTKSGEKALARAKLKANEVEAQIYASSPEIVDPLKDSLAKLFGNWDNG